MSNVCIFFYFNYITDLVVVTHTHLELDVNFERHVLAGKAILDVEKKGVATELVSRIFPFVFSLLFFKNIPQRKSFSY